MMAARHHRRIGGAAGVVLLLLLLAGAARAVPAPGPLTLPDTALEPLAFGELEGWAADDHAAAFATFRASCAPLARRQRLAVARPFVAALMEICRRVVAMPALDAARARAFVEANFRPVRIFKLGDVQ